MNGNSDVNLVCDFTATTMDIHSEIRLIQTGPGISVSYTIFSSESISPGDFDALEIGQACDLFVSTSTLYFKNQQNQWIVVAEGDRVYNPNLRHQYCILLLSDTGPCWGYHGDTFSVTIAEAIQQLVICRLGLEALSWPKPALESWAEPEPWWRLMRAHGSGFTCSKPEPGA